MDLSELRKRIDAVDREIVTRLNERVRLACEIGRIKAQTGQDFYVPSREELVFEKLQELNEGPLPEAGLRAIYREVMSSATALQKPLGIAYLGPEATYTHQAAVKNFGRSVQYLPFPSIPDVFHAVERGEADYGVVPIENSTEGAVGIRSLELLVESPLKVIAQVYLEVSHCLISRSALAQIRVVRSKDNALGQCRQWLARHLPHAVLEEAASTAAAVEQASSESGVAAIAGRLAAELYGVPIVAEGIHDRAENVTRFLVLGRTVSAPLGGGRDRTSLAFTLNDEVGSLQSVLQAFSKRRINMVKIESRPSRQKLWDYIFFIDVVGHIEDAIVSEAMAELKRLCPQVKWLGSYPQAG